MFFFSHFTRGFAVPQIVGLKVHIQTFEKVKLRIFGSVLRQTHAVSN
jgi:hypothetical protein